MILLLGSQKGGCGKSTLATNIAAVLSRQDKDVVIVDADRQGTSATWSSDREQDSTLPRINHVRLYDNIRKPVLDLAERYEVVIIDAAGRDSPELRSGATAADIMLVPFRPSQADLDTLPSLVEVANQAKIINEKLRCLAILTMSPTNPSINEADESREYFTEWPELPLAQTTIHDRKVYRDCMSEGKGAVEADNSKAKKEINDLVEEALGAW